MLSQQMRKRNSFAKGVQFVDALEVYQQKRNGELTVRLDNVASLSQKTVSSSSYVTILSLRDEDQFCCYVQLLH